MNVVIVHKYAQMTAGADPHCFGLADELTKRGHEVRFLSTLDERNEVTEGVFVPLTVTHGSREKMTLRGQAGVFVNAIWNMKAAAGMRHLIQDFRPDVVHVHKLYPQLSVAPIVVASRAGIPIVQTLHDFEMIGASPIDAQGGRWDTDETRIRYKLLNSATRPVRRRVHAPRVSVFIAVSRFVARLHAKHGIHPVVLPNFVPDAHRERDGSPSFDERQGVVFLGRLRPEKGALDVVELARRLPEIPVKIVGSGDLEAEIRGDAERLPNLEVAGFVPDPALRAYLRSARVVVIPSRCHDAGPLVPLESMAHATPVVAYAMGGLGEYVSDTGGGRVVPVDVEALTAAASELHDDRTAWEACSRSGHEAIAARHTPSIYAQEIERIYEDVVARARNGR